MMTNETWIKDRRLPVTGNGNVELVCPRCGSGQMHQGAVTIWNRSEDADPCLRTAVSGSAVTTEIVTDAAGGNPSSRRQGLAIDMNCEQCGGDLQLTVAQHKGQTEIGWRYLPKAPTP